MVTRFLSLLEKEKDKAHHVLGPQIHNTILKYLVGGFFDKEQKRMIAFALMPVDKDFFWKYNYLLDFSRGHSSRLFGLSTQANPKSGMSIVGPQTESLEEEIKSGIYHFNLVSFYAEYDFNEWNILPSSCFTNSKDRLQIFKSELNKLNGNIKDRFFNQPIFDETGKHYEKHHLRFKERLKQRPMPNFPNREIEMKIPVEQRPFIGHSFLVALIRLEKKNVINKAYITYCQKAIFEPLTVKLKTFFPEEYLQIEPFQFYPCSMVFPDHKRYCLFICLVADKTKKPQLKFFFYLQENNQVYEWIYFPPSIYEDHKVNLFTIHKIFEPISKLDDQKYLIDPRCTLDDEDFWNNYVLKKDDYRYVYLKEIKFE